MVLLLWGLATLIFTWLTSFYITDQANNKVREQLRKLDRVVLEALDSIADHEVRHIGFLKVHKAASSTMQNIFFRFGMSRNLTFIFTEHPNYFSRSPKLNIPLVKPYTRRGHDILCIHSVFNEDLYSKFLPSDLVYIGIVRNPVTLFVSAVNFYSQPPWTLTYLKETPGNRLHSLIESPDKYDDKYFSYTRNVMARDFGFERTLDKTKIQKKLEELDKRFKLVLVAEYFEESLVLMRRYLNWKLQDILFISNNVLFNKTWTVSELNETHLHLLKKRNKLDYAVYNFFYDKFWRQLKAEFDIQQEVLYFKDILKSTEAFCKSVRHRSGRGCSENKTCSRNLVIKSSHWNKEFRIMPIDCQFMKMEELKFIKVLRRLQGSIINETIY